MNFTADTDLGKTNRFAAVATSPDNSPIVIGPAGFDTISERAAELRILGFWVTEPYPYFSCRQAIDGAARLRASLPPETSS